MNYQTFKNLQLRPLLKQPTHGIHSVLRDTSDENLSLYLWVLSDLFWCLEKLPIINFNEKHIARWLLQDK